MNFDFIKNWFKKRGNSENLTLEDCISKGLLSKEEILRIKKDRAIRDWENEILNLRQKKK